MVNTTSKNFEEFSKRTFGHLSSRYSDFVAHTIQLRTMTSAVSFLRNLSFASEDGSEIRTPDHIQAAIHTNQRGEEAFLVIGGQLSIEENYELLEKCTKQRLYRRSVAVGNQSDRSFRDFASAMKKAMESGLTMEMERTFGAESSNKKKWWQFWKRGGEETVDMAQHHI